MLVTEENFGGILHKLARENVISCDTETTGLEWYKDARPFAIIIADKSDEYYFNFNTEPNHLGESCSNVLSFAFFKELSPLFLNVMKKIYFANAKFDLHMLKTLGINVESQVVDVLVLDRLLFNDHMKYGLDSVAKRHGLEKSEAVEEYITEHHLWEWVDVPGKKNRKKNKWFYKVPLSIMQPYAEKDARITYQLGGILEGKLKGFFTPPRAAPNLLDIETNLTKVCFKMEHEGIPIDEDLCEIKAAEYTLKYTRAAREFQDKTGQKLIDSAKCFGPIFAQAGIRVPKTDKGADSFTDGFLESLQSPLGKMIQNYREPYKIANTYYRSFQWYQSKGVIHADIKQAGTRTGRFSYSDPNLQNVPDSEVRKVFVPPAEYCFVSIDYDQQEYKVMVDYAGEAGLIDKIKAGLDVHTATAELMKVDRKFAKTLNFMLLYGGGTVKLALALFPVTLGEQELWSVWREHKGWKNPEPVDVPEDIAYSNLQYLKQAEELKELYFTSLPKVKKWIDAVINGVKARSRTNSGVGYVQTWTGRKLWFREQFAYKAPNAIIQGGCSDVAKIAMIRLDKFLTGRKSKMLVQIHDELLFKVHKSELEIVPELQKILENVFPHRFIALSTSVSHSWKSWGDLTEGLPVVEEAGDEVQGEGDRGSKKDPTHLVL